MRLVAPAVILALAGMPAFAQSTSSTTAQAAAQPADELLAAVNAVQFPTYDRAKAGDREYVNEYIEARNAAWREQAELIGQLYKTAPDHEALNELLPKRWSALTSLRDYEPIIDEAGKVMHSHADTPLAIEAAYSRASAIGSAHGYDSPEFMPAFKAFAKLAPDDARRGSRLLMGAARASEGDAAIALYERVIEAYPESSSAGYAKGKIRQVKGVGKPFELTFTEATSGETIDMKDLKGKVVVIDFWATWCGPCVAELPHMKELYAQYKDKGVEFVGVSLDQAEAQGGLEKLRNFCAENEIAWPQYYQGNYWQSEFSTSWGINSIPAIFVVDKQGNLHSTNARGKLNAMIPELLGVEGAG